MNLIIDKSDEGGAIYLGNLEAASNVEYLKRHNIGAVLTVAGNTGLRYSQRDIPMHEIIHADDALYQDLSQYFPRIIRFIEEARSKTNILVHCYAGISRSVTSVVAYLMQKRQWTYERTISFVKAQRSIANPNPSFVKQLKRYESTLRPHQQQSHSISVSRSSPTNPFNQQQNLHSSQMISSQAKQAIDEMFDSPSKRSASSYGSRMYQGEYQSSPVQAFSQQQQQQQQQHHSYQQPYQQQYQRNVYSSASNVRSIPISLQQPVTRLVFEPSTTMTNAAGMPSNKTNYGYTQLFSKPSPIFQSAQKNNLYVSRIQSAHAEPRTYYSRPLY